MVVIDSQLLNYLLNLAKIPKARLTVRKQQKLQKDLSDILDYIDKLNQVKTDKVEILTRPYDLSNIGHQDEVRAGLDLGQVFGSKAIFVKGYFQISQLIDKDKDETVRS